MERISANQRRLALVNTDKSYAIETEILEHITGEYVLVEAVLKYGDRIVTVHKLKYAESKFDDSYISWAETMAISKAIGFVLADESDAVHTQDEFIELVSRKTKEFESWIDEGGNISTFMDKVTDPSLKTALQPMANYYNSQKVMEVTKKQANENTKDWFAD